MCDRCSRCEYSHRSLRKPLTPIQVISEPWYKVGMDLSKPKFPSPGYQYILTVSDIFTKYIEARSMKSKSAEETRRCLFSIYERQGAPVEILCDNGRKFVNFIMKNYKLPITVK